MDKWRRGSYTIEAALLMSILLPLLTGIIYLGFYLHNRAYLQAAAYELAATASLLKDQGDVAKILDEKKEVLLNGRLLGRNRAEGVIEIKNKEVLVKLKDELVLPGIILGLFSNSTLEIEVNTSLKLEDPAKIILQIHHIKKWTEGVKNTS